MPSESGETGRRLAAVPDQADQAEPETKPRRWPVELTRSVTETPYARVKRENAERADAPQSIAVGEPVRVQAVTAEGSRPERPNEVAAYYLECPLCGQAGRMPRTGHESGGVAWTFKHDGDGQLTATPSVRCSCGGHFWLSHGTLVEV